LYLEKQNLISDPVPDDPGATPRRSTRVLKPAIKPVSTIAPIKLGTQRQTPRKGQSKTTRKNTSKKTSKNARDRTLSASPNKATRKSLRRSDTSSARLWDKANGEGINDDDEGINDDEEGINDDDEDIGKGNSTMCIPYFIYIDNIN
jgi:hypothetical protein